MGITGHIKHISSSTLDTFLENPENVELFFLARYSSESKKVNKFSALKAQYISEWQSKELDLDKSWQELTYTLAGYTSGSSSRSNTIIPELKTQTNNKPFLQFFVISNSEWDSLPLVNAFGAGISINEKNFGYEKARYLTPEQVREIANGLSKLGEKGFQIRLKRLSKIEFEVENPYFYNLESIFYEFQQEALINYFNEMLDYYQSASSQNSAMLIYLC